MVSAWALTGRRFWLVGLLALWLPLGVAAEELRLHAVFGERAVVSVGDERAVVSTGDTGPGGMRVLRTGPGMALVEYRGEQRELRVQPRPAPARPDPSAGEAGAVRVHRDSRGDHAVTAGLNGTAVTLVVDPQADSVLLRASDAGRVGIDPDQGRSVRFRDELGTRHGQRVRIDQLQVGGLRRAGVSAIVLPDGDLPRSRLGRSFLEHFAVERDGDALVIRDR
ncbi:MULTISPECIES: TIGR02281 family clan AA aspartic protease [unclassified Thioalkalivibrio]|uniref:retropepsin-like aspartic protease family protein n=1 Tax=unclassified Thioalkalivibrio TaxID=2621013 RepID=UPI00037F75C1|nr:MULTISPECIES: TIGR02281 family clan AA aspartic protease [unclassified Thioalkalivibrio]